MVTFDKHKIIVRKHEEKIIEGCQNPMNGLLCFPLYDPVQNNQ